MVRIDEAALIFLGECGITVRFWGRQFSFFVQIRKPCTPELVIWTYTFKTEKNEIAKTRHFGKSLGNVTENAQRFVDA
jgi:hypothetical protein